MLGNSDLKKNRLQTRWVAALGFNVLFRSISVILGQWTVGKAMCNEPCLWLKGFLPPVGIKPGTATPADQGLIAELWSSLITETGRVLVTPLLAHLARRAIVSYCHTNVSVVCRPSTLKNKYSNIFFYNTTGPTVLKFHLEYDLTPGSQNCKIGLGRKSRMTAVTKNSKNNKINFFSRTTGYFWLNFGMEYKWNIGIQNCKNEKNL